MSRLVYRPYVAAKQLVRMAYAPGKLSVSLARPSYCIPLAKPKPKAMLVAASMVSPSVIVMLMEEPSRLP